MPAMPCTPPSPGPRSRAATCFGLFLGLVLALPAPVPAAPTGLAAQPETVRELHVPFDAIPVLFEEQSDRVLLPRAQFDELRAKARREAERHPPLPVLLLGASYRVVVNEDRAAVSGEIHIAVLGAGLQSLDLPFTGLGLRQAALDGEGAPLGRAENGALTLFLSGVGNHLLTLEAVAPLQTTAARQILDVAMPTPPGTRLTLTVPGDVELKSGAAVAKRVWDDAAAETRFELVPESPHLALVMTLNSRLKRRDRVVVARSVVLDEITEAYERLHATLSFDILHRAVDDLHMRLPEGFEVIGVHSPLLARWAVQTGPEGPRLDVFLREETTGTVTLGVLAQRGAPDLSSWRMPRLDCLDVDGRVAVLGVLLEKRLRIEGVQSEGVLPIDTTVLVRALPATIRDGSGGGPELRPALAYYAPSPEFLLEGRFSKPPPRLRVTTNLLLTVRRKGLALRGGFALLGQYERRFGVSVAVPAGWDVTAVHDSSGQALEFERYGEADAAGRILVRFPHGMAADAAQDLVVEASHVPAGWLDTWSEKRIEFPCFAILDAGEDTGAVAVNTEDDLRARPDALEGLTPLHDNEKNKVGLGGVQTMLAYRYEHPPYACGLVLDHVPARTTAETFSFFRFGQGAVVCHAEIAYDVVDARVSRLAFALPPATPVALSIRGLGETTVKESTYVDGPEARRWQVELAQPSSGTLTLAVDYEMPLGEGIEEAVELPLPTAADVLYQSGFLAVEGNAELDVQVRSHPRRVDIGELADAEYQPGPRLLGAYGFLGEPPTVTVAVLRPASCALPPAIIQDVHIATVLSAHGVAQSQARFALRTKALYLEIHLPPGAQLWSVTVDGTPASPQQEGERILLDLPAGEHGGTRELLVLYEMPVPAPGLLDRVPLRIPRLVFHGSREAAGADLTVPAMDVRWTVYPPAGYRILGSSGSAVEQSPEHPGLAAVSLLRALYRAAGGIEPRHGLLGGCVLALGSAKAKARAASAYHDREVLALEQTLDGFSAEAAAPAPTAAPALNRESEERERDEAHGRQPAAGGPPPGPGETPAKQEPADAPDRVPWALEGARSLDIRLVTQGDGQLFRSLDDAPEVVLLLGGAGRLDTLLWAVVAGVLVLGAALTGRSSRDKALYLALVLGAATVLPAAPGLLWLTAIMNAAFYAACLLVPYYLLAGLVRGLGRFLAGRPPRARSGRASPAAPRAVAGVFLVLFALCALALSVAHGAEGAPPRHAVVVEGSPVVPPVRVPKDALVVPYTPGAEGAGAGVLVPREHLAQLWQAAYPEPERAAPPAPFGFTGLALRGELAMGDALVLRGTLDFEVFAEGYVDLALPLQGLVFSEALLDGRPARWRVVQDPAAPEAQGLQQQAAAPAAALTRIGLSVTGRGRHRIEMTAKVRLERRGGWRIAACRLPAVPTTTLDLTVAEDGTEVRLNHVPDRQAYEALPKGEVIRTTLAPDGRLDLHWRPRVSEGQVDRSLSVVSRVVFDVLDDRLQTAWALAMRFRHGDRMSFSVDVPLEYRIEKVEGTNVRGWEVRREGAGQRLEVTLLKQAKEEESFTVHAWRAADAGPERRTVEVPVLTVPDAVRHSGRLTVRHSPALELRAGEQEGTARVDVDPEAVPPVRDNPLGVKPFQAFAFARVPFLLRLDAAPARPEVTAAVQSILRISERERQVESRIVLSVAGRPLHRARIEVPAALEVEHLTAPGAFEWGVTAGDDRRLLTVYFADGLQQEIPLVLSGRYGQPGSVDQVEVPRLWVQDMDRQEGDIAVLADPLYDLAPRGLLNLEGQWTRAVLPWLSEAQRPFARLALHYRAADHAGTLVLQPRRPDVHGHTVTSVRVTDRTVEETTLVCFHVGVTGVAAFRLRLPARLADARISVPLLRQKTVEALPGGEEVLVVLELQDMVIGDVRVLIEDDRLLTDAPQELALPTVETGRTDRQYVAVESAGRDEVIVTADDSLEALTPQQKEWGLVAELFQGGTCQAFIAKPDRGKPRLTFRTRPRQAVETAGARIGLATTLLTLDDNGWYRASQVYQVDNRIEQFLHLELPEGASLWTVRVGSEMVKPILPDPAMPSLVHVPLVKTAAGDLDYPVVIKYAGRVEVPGPILSGSLPFVRTLNINVEQSQVELWLPTTRRWFGFGGTLSRVRRSGEFEAGYLAYQNKLAKRLMDTLEYGSVFEKARAAGNLKQVNEGLAESNAILLGQGLDNADLRVQLDQSRRLITTAGEQLRQAESEQTLSVRDDNRWRMNMAFGRQAADLARNQAVETGENWDVTEVRQGGKSAKVATFDDGWFSRNGLVAATPEQTETPAQDAEKKPRAPAPPAAKPAPPPPDLAPVELKAVEIAGKLIPRDAAGQVDGTGVAQRRDMLNRAAQYQQKLADAKAKQIAPPQTLGLTLNAAGDVSAMAGIPGQDRQGALTGARFHLANGMGMGGQGGMGLAAGDDLTFAYIPGAAGLVSLDVDLPGFDPQRWQCLRFATPRGAVAVSARALSNRVLAVLLRVFAAAVAVALVAAVFGLRRPLRFSASAWVPWTRYLMLVGFLCLLIGILPALGALLLIGGFVGRIALAVARPFVRRQSA
ncbi:MAG: hypothetical protein JXR77_04450 [Lentisphaeria bacterium]|nr:hypothetical protein [Lentisphaeria bacterium]